MTIPGTSDVQLSAPGAAKFSVVSMKSRTLRISSTVPVTFTTPPRGVTLTVWLSGAPGAVPAGTDEASV